MKPETIRVPLQANIIRCELLAEALAILRHTEHYHRMLGRIREAHEIERQQHKADT